MQSRAWSFLESLTNLLVSLSISLGINGFLLPAMGYPISWTHNFLITGIFALISLARGYILRRIFNAKGRRP